MHAVTGNKSTSLKLRLLKFFNGVLLFLSIGSCIFILSVINTKDTYTSFIENSGGQNSAFVLFLANSVLNLPMFVIMVLLAILAIGKEFYFKPMAVRLKINTISAILLLL